MKAAAAAWSLYTSRLGKSEVRREMGVTHFSAQQMPRFHARFDVVALHL